MGNIHEDYGYKPPDLTTVYLGIFEEAGVWKAAHRAVDKSSGHRLETAHALKASAEMVLFMICYEGKEALQATEIQPFVDLVFQQANSLGFAGTRISETALNDRLALLEERGFIPEGSREDIRAILVEHRNEWPDRRPIKFMSQPQEPRSVPLRGKRVLEPN